MSSPSLSPFFAISSDSNFLLIVAALVTLIYLAARRMNFGHDPREPPLAPQSIPLIGHMVGLSKSSFNYYVDLRYLYLILSD
jgi:hypothetical protein